MTDLDDTTRCPIAAECEGCGSTHDLRVVTVGTVIGVYCVTLCAADRVRPSRLITLMRSIPQAVRRCLDHCVHLGIDADEMDRQMQQEESPA